MPVYNWYPKSSNLSFSIIGDNGNGSILTTRPLYLKSDYSSGGIPLYLKSTPTGSAVPAITNWDISLASNARINDVSNGDVEYVWTDFSSNRHDAYYTTNQGQDSLSYTLSHSWNINDLSLNEDLLVVATKDWASFEKYTVESDAKVVAGYFDKLQYYWSSSYYTEDTVYNYYIYWDTFHGNSISYTADLVITYTYGDQVLESRTTINDNDEGTIYFTSTSVINPLTDIVWEGDSNDTTFWDDSAPYTTSTEIVGHTVPPPIGSIARNGAYVLPSELNPKLSRFLIPDFVQIFQDPNRTWFKFAGNTTLIGSEVPDYSDIYLNVAYDSGSGSNSRYLYNLVNIENESRLYKFGGFLKFEEFYSELLDPSGLDVKMSIADGDEKLWYIILKDGFGNSGEYYSVGLSDYVTWNYEYQASDYGDEFHSLVYYKSDLELVEPGSLPKTNHEHYEPLDLRYASTKLLQVVKVAGFPNCGKVDLYFPKTGTVQDIQNGSYAITSSGHQLSSGDRIKFTEVLAPENTLNGLRYVIPIDDNQFNIYYDKNGINPAYVNGVSTPTGIRWSAIDGNTWRYSTTIYSPTDKNGYGTGLKLISSYEPPNTGESPFDRAIEWNTDKPQSDFTGQRSWTNYYPYERFDSSDNQAFQVVNGNKFGTSVASKKIDHRYLLMVAEEGASESFNIVSPFLTNTEEETPTNQRVVPSFLPYGRIHFYIVTPETNSVEYLTSYSPSDNPWVGYETVNRQERLLGIIDKWENAAITINDLYSYNSTSNNYWNGARFLQWNGNYAYDSNLSIEFPDQNAKLYHYGYVDRIKAADFEILGNSVYCTYIPNVKNADFYNASRIYNLDSYVKLLTFNIDSPAAKTSKWFTVNNSTFSTSDVSVQKAEYDLFGKSVQTKNGKLFFGWPSLYKTEEYIYYYTRSGTSFYQKDIVSSVGTNSFGARFVEDDGILISDFGPSQTIEVYKYDGFGDQYYYLSNFATNHEILSYGLVNDVFVVRNETGYAGYAFDRSSSSFNVKFNKEAPRTTANSIMKLGAGNHAAFFDSGIEYDVGSYHKSLQILDAGSVNELSLNNYLFALDTHYPEYVPLYIKTTDGSTDESLSLFAKGHESYGSGLPVNLQAPIKSSGNIDLFVQQVDLKSTGISLYHKSTSLVSGELSLFAHNGLTENELPLVMNSPLTEQMPLYLASFLNSDLSESGVSLFIDSFRTFSKLSKCALTDNNADGNNDSYTIDGNDNEACGIDGNIDGIVWDGYDLSTLRMPLFIAATPSGQSSGVLPLVILAPGTGYQSSVNLYHNSNSVFNGSTIFVHGSGYKGFESSGEFNLWIQRPTTEMVPLFVYNTVTTGNVPAYISGANVVGTGLNLGISGVHIPNEILRLYVRGDL